MTPPEINFYSEDLDFELDRPAVIAQWLQAAVEEEGKSLFSLSIVFCTDPYLHELNVQYLQHDTLTDVITFPYGEDPIEGDIYISIDRVEENAAERNLDFLDELSRIMIHGTLHLIGYGDKTAAEKQKMTEMENKYLPLLQLKLNQES